MPLNVLDPETIHGMAQAARQGLRDLEFADAVLLWDSIEPLRKSMTTLDLSVRADAEELVGRLCVAALPTVADKELLEQFAASIKIFLDEADLDLVDLLRRKLLNMPFIEDRDEYRQKLRDVLMDNMVEITRIPAPGAARGTVGEWVHAYVSVNQENDSLRQAQFLTPIKSQGGQYSSDEQGRLERLVQVFDYLRLSSAAEGFEDQSIVDMDGKWVTFENGRPVMMEPYQDKQGKLIREEYSRMKALDALKPSSLEESAIAYQGAHPTELVADMQMVEKLAIGEKGDVVPEQAIAVLQRACIESTLKEVVWETGAISFQDLFESVLVQTMGMHPDVVAAIAGRTVAKLSPEERKIHAHEVYYDMSEGKFVWGDPVIIPIE